MEFFACVVGGVALLGCGAGLFLVRPPDWPQDESLPESTRTSIARWSKFQIGMRYVNNALLMISGAAIASTAFVPHGRSWMVLWSIILLLLMACIVLAVIDALTSLSSYRKALPQAARRSLGSDQEHSQ